MNSVRPGFVLVDKPPGITSHGVVGRLRKVFGVRRIGHSGTLDPSATGLLVCGVGSATRLLDRVKADTKVYETVGRFGVTTSTLDADGDVLETRPVPPDIDVAGLARKYVGAVMQIPPVISAIKIEGERAYDRARRGEDVEMPSREVRIDSIEVLSVSGTDFRLRVVCGPGTYIRTLVADMGEDAECGAHVVELRRTAIGHLIVTDAVGLDEVTPDHLRDPSEILQLEVLTLDAEQAKRARNGQRFEVNHPDAEVLVVDDHGTVGVFRVTDGVLVAVTVLGN